jgi:hypothetical protein
MGDCSWAGLNGNGRDESSMENLEEYFRFDPKIDELFLNIYSPFIMRRQGRIEFFRRCSEKCESIFLLNHFVGL